MITKVKKIVDNSNSTVKANFKKFINENLTVLNSKDSKAINEKLLGFLSSNNIIHDNFNVVEFKTLVTNKSGVFAILEKYNRENKKIFSEAKKVFEKIERSGRFSLRKMNEELSILEHKYSHLSRKINENAELDLNTGTFDLSSIQDLKDNFDPKFVEKNLDKFDDVALNDLFYSNGVVDLTISKDSNSMSGYTASIMLNASDKDGIDKNLERSLNSMAKSYFESGIVDYISESINEDGNFSDDKYDIFAKAKASMNPEDIDHHASDLYLKINDISTKLVADYMYPQNVTKFRSQTDGNMWYEIPFAWYNNSINEDANLKIGVVKIKSMEELSKVLGNFYTDHKNELETEELTRFFDYGGYIELDVEEKQGTSTGYGVEPTYTTGANYGYMLDNTTSQDLDRLFDLYYELDAVNYPKSVNEDVNLNIGDKVSVFDDNFKYPEYYGIVKSINDDTVNLEIRDKTDRVVNSSFNTTLNGVSEPFGDVNEDANYGVGDVFSDGGINYKITSIDDVVKYQALSDSDGEVYDQTDYGYIKNNFDSMVADGKIKLKKSPINEDAIEPEIISQLRKIVSDSQYQDLTDSVTGSKMTVDMGSAANMLQIYNNINDAQKTDFVSKGLKGMFDMTNRIFKKFESVNESAYSEVINESSEEDYKQLEQEYQTKKNELFSFGNGWTEGFGNNVSKNYGDEKYIKILTISIEADFVAHKIYYQVRVGYSKTPNYGAEADKFYSEQNKLSDTQFNTVQDAVNAADKFADKWNSKPVNEDYDEFLWYGKPINLSEEIVNKIKEFAKKFNNFDTSDLSELSTILRNHYDGKGTYESQQQARLLVNGFKKSMNEDATEYVDATELVKEKIKDWDGKGVLRFELSNPLIDEDKQLFLTTSGRDIQDKFKKPYQVMLDDKSVIITNLDNIDKKGNIINESADEDILTKLGIDEIDYNELSSVHSVTVKSNRGDLRILLKSSESGTYVFVMETGLGGADGSSQLEIAPSIDEIEILVLEALNDMVKSNPINEDEDGLQTTKQDWENILQTMKRYNRTDGFVGDVKGKLTFFDSKPSFPVMSITLDDVENIIKSDWDSINESAENDNLSYFYEQTGSILTLYSKLINNREKYKDVIDYLESAGSDWDKIDKSVLNQKLKDAESVSINEDNNVDYKQLVKNNFPELSDEMVDKVANEYSNGNREALYHRLSNMISQELGYTDVDGKEDDLDNYSKVISKVIQIDRNGVVNESSDENYITEYTQKDEKFRYMLLSRMESDCDYFLGNGKGYEGHLFMGDKVKQIKLMNALWDSFTEKPEWLSKEQIADYAKQMGVSDAINEDYAEKRDKLYSILSDWSDSDLKEVLADLKYNGDTSSLEEWGTEDLINTLLDDKSWVESFSINENDNSDDQNLTNFYKVVGIIKNGGYDFPQEVFDQYLTDDDVKIFIDGYNKISSGSHIDNFNDNIINYIKKEVEEFIPKNIILQYT